MIEYYLEIRWFHVASVVASGSLFAFRGLARVIGFTDPKAISLRLVGYSVDTVLLTTALMLVTILRQYPFVHSWLTVKVLLLPFYVVLGVVAFRRRGSRHAALVSWIAGLLVFVFIASVARAHHPLGMLRLLIG